MAPPPHRVDSACCRARALQALSGKMTDVEVLIEGQVGVVSPRARAPQPRCSVLPCLAVSQLRR